MTLGKRRPYTEGIRTLWTVVLLALGGCATDVASRAELKELTASMRALRADNARLETRLERLERGQPRSAPPAAGLAVPAAKSELPPLTVVKMKPRRDPAPKLATEVSVVEPPEGMVEEIRAPAPDKADAPTETEAQAADAQYQRGVDSLHTGNVEGAAAQLQQFAADWPRHPHADNALYFAGLAQMSLENWEAAAKLFESVGTRYPAGDAVVDCMLKLADCRLKLNRPQEAKATWERIVTTFPGTAAASQAQARLASLSSLSRSP